MILDETYKLLKSRHADLLNNLVISRVSVGVFLTAVQLSDGNCGVASTNVETLSNCYKKERDFEAFSPSKITGQNVIDLFEGNSSLRIKNTLKVAVLNAISSGIIGGGGYRILEGTDPVELLDLSTPKTISIVGAFQSYIKKISATKNKLYVLEMDENALNEDQKQYYVPADNYNKILPGSDVVIITGLTLVNNTIDDLLVSVSPGARVIVSGPSSGIIPDILFKRKVSVVGATRITNPDKLFSVVGEAGTGFHLFKYCAEKFCLVNQGNGK